MKILLTGGGTGGHFYPLIAVAEQLKKVAEENRIVEPQLYYMADDPYNERVLYEHDIRFIRVPSGKLRRDRSTWSPLNAIDFLKTIWGIIKALYHMFFIYPDVVFGKGGYTSFPALFAARILGIPVVIHESDTKPGIVNAWAGRFAKRVAVSYPGAVEHFPKNKTAITGNPLREEILNPITIGAHEFLDLDKNIPVIFIIGGSQGAIRINDAVLAILPALVNDFQVIHQVGKNNFDDCNKRTKVILEKNEHANRYKLFDYLNSTAMRMVAGVTDLVVSRAGSTIFEIANWGTPAIIIPIPESISHDQTTNAFTYAASGAAIVIEEENLTPSVLLSEIKHLMAKESLRKSMSENAKKYSRPDAAKMIAGEIINLALEHER